MLLLSEPSLGYLPIDVAGEGGEVISALDTVVGEVRVFEDIEDQEWICSSEVSPIVLSNPDIEDLIGLRIVNQYHPADATHSANANEILLPIFETPVCFHEFLFERAIGKPAVSLVMLPK